MATCRGGEQRKEEIMGGKRSRSPAPEPGQVTIDNIGSVSASILDEYLKDPEKYKAQMEDVGGNPITLGPRVPAAADWAADQVKGATGKAAKWLANSKRPKKVPSQAALAAKEKFYNRLREALDEGTWDKAMALVDEDLRLKIIEAVGESGFRSGVEAHKAKVEAAVKDLQPRVTALAEAIDKMPVATDDEREAKMLAARRGMIDIGRSRRGLSPKY